MYVIQSALSKIYWGSPANPRTSYRESISYGFVYTISNIYVYIYTIYVLYVYFIYYIVRILYIYKHIYYL